MTPVTTQVNTSCEKVYVSAKTLTGLDELKALIYEKSCNDSLLTNGLNISAGQLEDLRESLISLTEARHSIINQEGEDITAGLINSARILLLRVLGLDAGDELLDNMFNRFCVGK